MLGHPKRVRILELLQDGERAVGELQVQIELDSSGTSQHLAALRRLGLIEGRRRGTSVYYRVCDERVFDLLSTARAIVTTRITHAQSLLAGLDDLEAGTGMSSEDASGATAPGTTGTGAG